MGLPIAIGALITAAIAGAIEITLAVVLTSVAMMVVTAVNLHVSFYPLCWYNERFKRHQRRYSCFYLRRYDERSRAYQSC